LWIEPKITKQHEDYVMTISISSDIAVFVSAIIVATAALIGVKTWRRELTGKARFEVARRVMFLSYKFCEDFKSARSPFTFSYEHIERKVEEIEQPAITEVRNQWFARSQRLRPVVEDLSRLQEAQWEARIILGANAASCITEAFETFRQAYAEVSSAISTYFDIEEDAARSGAQYHDEKFLRELRFTIYERSEDKLSKQVSAVIPNLEKALESYVKSLNLGQSLSRVFRRRKQL